MSVHNELDLAPGDLPTVNVNENRLQTSWQTLPPTQRETGSRVSE